MNAPATILHETADAGELQKSFVAFTRISRSLEKAYSQLRQQAAQIDLALAETNARLDAVLRSLGTAVVVTDADGRVTLANRAFAELVGRNESELVGCEKRLLADDRGEPLCERSSRDPVEAQAVRPNRALRLRGERRVVRSSFTPVIGTDGAVRGELEAIADETEVEALREEVARRGTLTALGEMAAGIAHELRNPLTAVEGFAALLQRAIPADATECDDHARRIREGVRKANSIITNLLCFARPERFRPQRARLATLLHELRASYLPEAAGSEPKATVEVRAPEPATLAVACDLALLERVLVNLIENGRVAAGPEGRVVVRARAGDGEVVLTVEDDGPGIAPELREKLFRPFVTSRAEGTGLGLFLVHRIVELHQGRVIAGDRAGGGTVFTVRLPDPGTSVRSRIADSHALSLQGPTE